LTNQLRNKGFDILLINSDGSAYRIKDWKLNKTYYLVNQEKLIIKDNRTDVYEKSNEIKKKI
jgi:hypothetical protein